MTQRWRSKVMLSRDRGTVRLVHHTVAERKWAYDGDSPVGRLDRVLGATWEEGWTVIAMAQAWRVAYPWEKPS
jgi:hypothetical protein